MDWTLTHVLSELCRSIEDAEYVLVIPDKFAGSQEIVKLERRTLVCVYTHAAAALMLPDANCRLASGVETGQQQLLCEVLLHDCLVPALHLLQREGLRETEELGFEYRRQRFVYAADTFTFEKLRYPVKVGESGWQPCCSLLHVFIARLAICMSVFVPASCSPDDVVCLDAWCVTQETFETYSRMTGHGTEAKALAAHDKYGLNRFDVPIPPFMDLLKEHLVAPFFCFQ
jgi:hypothetical protein